MSLTGNMLQQEMQQETNSNIDSMRPRVFSSRCVAVRCSWLRGSFACVWNTPAGLKARTFLASNSPSSANDCVNMNLIKPQHMSKDVQRKHKANCEGNVKNVTSMGIEHEFCLVDSQNSLTCYRFDVWNNLQGCIRFRSNACDTLQEAAASPSTTTSPCKKPFIHPSAQLRDSCYEFQL